jgi:zinc protease
MMADTLLCPSFPPDEVEKLRGQILTDLKEEEDDTYAMAGRYFRELLYTPDHPYGRSVDGDLNSIASLTHADLLDYHRRLHPQNGAVIVVGDVTGDQVYHTLESLLGHWQPTTNPPDVTAPAPRPLTAPARHMHPMAGKFQSDLVLGWMGPPRRAEDFYAAYVGNTILGQLGLGGRIGLSVRDTEGLAYYANTHLQGGSGPGPWLAFAGVNPTGVERAINLILAEIRRFRVEPVTDDELADAKAYLTGILPLQMEANEGIAGILVDLHYFQLGDDFIARYPAIINGVTKEQVQAAAQKYLSDEVYALAVAGPVEG